MMNRILSKVFTIKTVPNLFTDIEVIEIDGKDIIKISVPKSKEIVATVKGQTYKRLGKNTKPYYPTDFNSNNLKRFSGDYSAKILERTNMDDIDLSEVERLKLKMKARDKDSTLHQSDNITFLKDLQLVEIRSV